MSDDQKVFGNMMSSEVVSSDLILFPTLQNDKDDSVLMTDAQNSETGLLRHTVIYYVTLRIECTKMYIDTFTFLVNLVQNC